MVVAGEVEGAEFAEYVVVEVLDAELLVYGVAYLVAQFFLLAVVATGIVLREEFRHSSLLLLGVVFKDGVLRDVSVTFLGVCQLTEVETAITLYERVALHNLVVKVWQW